MFKTDIDAKKANTSIRERLNLHSSVMVILILTILFLVLGVNGVFSNHAKELEASLNSQLENSCYDIQENMDTLTANSIVLSEKITEDIAAVLLEHGQSFADVQDNQQLIYEIQSRIYSHLNVALQSSQCSGVFAILDTTVNSGVANAQHSKTGLYLRFVNLNAENSVHQSVVLFRGIADIARSEKLELHNRWNLEFDTQNIPWYDDMLDSQIDTLSESYCVSKRMQLTETWEEIALLSVPILDQYGAVIGMCGAEVSAIYFKTNLPVTDSPYGKIMTILAPIDGDTIHIDEGMIGTTKNTRIEKEATLTIAEGEHFNRYTSENGKYIGTHEIIDLPSTTGEAMAVVTLLPESGYASYVAQQNTKWIVGSVLFFLFSLGLVFLFSKRFVAPIEKGLKNLADTEPSQYQQSGIREFDELMAILQAKSQQTSTVQEKEVLPKNMDVLIEEFTQRVETLTTTERTILQYFIEGYDLQAISNAVFISLATAKRHNTNINRKLQTTSKEELRLYIELFRRCDCLNKIEYHK